MINNEAVYINGDGETSRDFCYIDNTVQANILAATAQNSDALNQVYNVAVGDRTTLNDLFKGLQTALANNNVVYANKVAHRDFRAGDVRHSQADVSKANNLLAYEPQFKLQPGIELAMPWYIGNR